MFITNLGTIIGTLRSPATPPSTIPTSAATHVSVVAITSTVSRILFGTLTDMLAPAPASPHMQSAYNSLASLPPQNRRFSLSRINFMLLSALFLFLAQIIMASGFIQDHDERFWIISALVGSGYGALFSLVPLVITVIWGVENFGTNWGIVAMVPAAGAAVWGIVYAKVYQWAANHSSYGPEPGADIICYGKECYEATFWAMSFSIAIGSGLWIWAWKGRDGWSKREIAV
jgi:MFS family permease